MRGKSGRFFELLWTFRTEDRYRGGQKIKEDRKINDETRVSPVVRRQTGVVETDTASG
jgi:hypothetical protein